MKRNVDKPITEACWFDVYYDFESSEKQLLAFAIWGSSVLVKQKM